METIQTIPQPVIAEVAGIATAAGCQLVATCDLAVASSDGEVRYAGREDRAVLHDADGRAHARDRPQARDGDAAHGRADRRAHRGGVGPDQSRRRAGPSSRRRRARSRSASRRRRGFVVGLGKAAFYAQIDLDQPKAYAYAKEVMTMNALADGRAGRAWARSSASARRIGGPERESAVTVFLTRARLDLT